MKIRSGIKKAIAIGSLIGLLSTTPAINAEELSKKKNEWDFELSLDSSAIAIQGLEEQMFKIGNINEGYHWGFPEGYYYTWSYGSVLNPLKLDPGAFPKILVSPKVFVYNPFGWNFNLEGFIFWGSDSKKGEVDGLSSKNLGIVSAWDYIFWSYYALDEGYGSEDSPVYALYPSKAKTRYETSRDVNNLKANFFLNLPILPEVEILGGISSEFFNIRDMQKVQPVFHLEEKYTSRNSDGSSDLYNHVFHNNIELKVNSSVMGVGIGPLIGLKAYKNLSDWVKIFGDVSQSWLMSNIYRNATFLDIDDISDIVSGKKYDSSGNLIFENTIEQKTCYKGNLPFSSNYTYIVPQTKINLGLEFSFGSFFSLCLTYKYFTQPSLQKPAKFHYMRINNPNDPDELNKLDKFWEDGIKGEGMTFQGFGITVKIKS